MIGLTTSFPMLYYEVWVEGGIGIGNCFGVIPFPGICWFFFSVTCYYVVTACGSKVLPVYF